MAIENRFTKCGKQPLKAPHRSRNKLHTKAMILGYIKNKDFGGLQWYIDMDAKGIHLYIYIHKFLTCQSSCWSWLLEGRVRAPQTNWTISKIKILVALNDL